MHRLLIGRAEENQSSLDFVQPYSNLVIFRQFEVKTVVWIQIPARFFSIYRNPSMTAIDSLQIDLTTVIIAIDKQVQHFSDEISAQGREA